MPLPEYLTSVAVFFCERLLFEIDGVASAIRIVDIFYVATEKPAGAPEEALPLIQAWGVAFLKAAPGHTGSHIFELKLLNTVGNLSNLGDPIPTTFVSLPGLEDLPTGVTLQVQLNVAVKRFGTCHLCVFVDGQEIARAPFSIVQKPGVSTGYSVPPKELID